MNRDNYTQVLLEDMRSDMKAVLEIVQGIKNEMGDFVRKSDLEEVKSDIKVIKAAVTDTEELIS